jgi:hypothetical protein
MAAGGTVEGQLVDMLDSERQRGFGAMRLPGRPPVQAVRAGVES